MAMQALWRYAGASGRAWRLHAGHASQDLRELHARLLFVLRDALLHHLRHGSEANQLVALLGALAGRPHGPAPVTPAVVKVRNRSGSPPKHRRLERPMAVEIAIEKHDDDLGLPEGDGKEQLPAAAPEPDPVDAEEGGQEELKDESGDDRGTLTQRMTVLMRGDV